MGAPADASRAARLAGDLVHRQRLVAQEAARADRDQSAPISKRPSGPTSTSSAQIDSKNDLLAYFPPRRLAAEEIRDAMLAASGELNRELGGPGVFPEMNWEVALQPRHIMGSVAPAYIPSRTPAERNRRTIYAFRIRTLADPLLEVLNRPGSETSLRAPRRNDRHAASVRPVQQRVRRQPRAGDGRPADEGARDRRRADRRRLPRWSTAASRRPPRREKCLAHLARDDRASPASIRRQPTELPTKVRRGMVEELTGEMVHWDEDLSVLKDYQRDLMPWQVDAATRALADVCLVLLNSNEFLYVR